MAHSAKYLQERVSLIMRHPIHPSISGILSSYFPSIEPLYQKPFVNYACCLAISLLKLCSPSSVRGKTFEVRQRSSIFHMVYFFCLRSGEPTYKKWKTNDTPHLATTRESVYPALLFPSLLQEWQYSYRVTHQLVPNLPLT